MANIVTYRYHNGRDIITDCCNFLTNKDGVFDKYKEKKEKEFMDATMRRIDAQTPKKTSQKTEWEKKVENVFG